MASPAFALGATRCWFVYSHDYYCDLGPHVFPTVKYRMVRDMLVAKGRVPSELFIEPPPATRRQLLLVHTPEYLDDLFSLRHPLSTPRLRDSEMPLSREIVSAFVLGAGGTILAARKALEDGLAVNLSGGFHHAYPDRAEGFCYLNDVAVATRVMQEERRVENVLIVDCDLHQGNGTARIFSGDPHVLTFSIHQENNYPPKEKSCLDVGLPDGTDDDEYLAHLEKHLPEILAKAKPSLVFYLAGADPYEGDQLGGLALTVKGLRKRDDYVVSSCLRQGVPVCGVLAGGYAFHVEDTVRIHYNTCIVFLTHAGESRAPFRARPFASC